MIALGMALAFWLAAPVAGQEPPANAGRAAPNPTTPSILTAPPGGARAAGGAMQVVSTEPLERMVTLDLQNVRLNDALKEINRQARLGLAYTPRVVPVDRRVTIKEASISAGDALERVLRGTGVKAVVTEAGTVTLVKQERKAEREAKPEAAAIGAVEGVVVDAASKRPLGGAVVTIKGTDLQTSTNDKGWYGMRVPAGMQTVVARFLGYGSEEQEAFVPETTVVRRDFALHMAMSRLQETVTTATGRQRRLELGNDITVINADSIVATQPVTSVTDLLEGRVPGMVIQRTSGAPGDPARIRLRGASSPRLSNDPIIIVDGIRVYSDQSGERGANLANIYKYAAPSPLDYIDPNSIETIEVVKGPSAATLYGQDAANGVIVITTKKGQSGPARWTVSAERGMTEMPGRYPELMVRWGHPLLSDTRIFCPIDNRISSGASQGAACQADSTVRFQMLNDPDLTVLDKGSRTAATIGVSGGSNALTYSVTGSYRDELGLVKLPTYEAERFRAVQGTAVPGWMDRPQKLTRWGATSRLLAQLGSKADVALSANISRTEQQRSSLEQQLGTLMSVYLDRSSGTYYQMITGRGSSIAPTTETLTNYYERATAAATDFTNGANLNWRPLSWLTATADAGINVVQRSDETLLPAGYTTGRDAQGVLGSGRGSSVTRTVNLRAQARIPLPHGFNLQLATGANYTGESVEDLTGNIRGLAKGTEMPIPSTSQMIVGQRDVDDATFGWYVEPQISHKRFWLSTGLRLDGGSTFGTRAKLPAFPKVSLSYLVSDEGFFPFKNLIPLLRLRLAYGQAGRQPGPVDKLRLYQAAVPVMVDGQLVDAVAVKSIGNTKLRPERSTEFEAGFDADLLGDRLTLGVTGFRKTTTDAMLSVPLAPSVYGSGVEMLKNIGVIRNSGFEASLGARVLRTDPVSLDVQVQLSQQRNEVVELGPGVEPFYSTGDATFGGARVAAGYPLFGRWTKPLLGYADANGNGYLEESEVLVGDTAVFVGGTLPNYTASLNTTLTLLRGAIAVTAGFSYDDGMSQNNEVGRQLAPFTAAWNDPNSSLADQAGVWDPTGFSWIQTVSTFRFSSLAVTYHAPTSLAQRLGARALSLSVQGTNLGLRTNYRGLDPNVNAFSTGNGVTDTGVLPQPRTWQVRVSANY
jgi:TonB-linked SusC/RagA family outer membrane protein